MTTASLLHAKLNNNHLVSKKHFGIRQLFLLCLPLMATELSSALMIFLDRVFLAQYDTQAMVAATTAANIFFIFQIGSVSIAMVGEVFVGQYNGAKQYKQLGSPVWQMIWFSLLFGCAMIPIGIWGGQYIFTTPIAEHAIPYFTWIMIFGPLFPLCASLSTFYLGRGDFKTLFIAFFIGNLANVPLSYLFIFGIEGIVQGHGTQGAAISTGVANIIIFSILLKDFIKPAYRKMYGTHQWMFSKVLFQKSIKIGLPNALGHLSATTAWALNLIFLSKLSFEHVTLASIALSIWMLSYFVTDCLQKSTTAVAANYIGANHREKLPEILKAGLKIFAIFMIILAIPLMVLPKLWISLFLPENTQNSVNLINLVQSSLLWLWIAIFFDGMVWVVDGILTAIGDTKFIFYMNAIGTWIFFLLPVYLFVYVNEGAPILTIQISTIFCCTLFICYYLRFLYNERHKRVYIQL